MSEPAVATPLPEIEVPAVLRSKRGWVVWKFQPDPKRPEKPKKMPYYVSGRVRSGTNGSPEDREQLVDFDTAMAACRRGGFDGVGFATLPDFGVVALDFDGCVMGGLVDPTVSRLVANTYCELSPSGTGVRAFMLGSLHNQKSRATADQWGFETFHDTQFVTVTGDALDICRMFGNEDTVADLTPEVVALFNQRFPKAGGQTQPKSQEEEKEADISRAFALGSVNDDTLADLRDALLIGLAKAAPGLSYKDWTDIGQALKSLEQAGRGAEALTLWHDFSALDPARYSADDTDQKWESYSPSRITYKSIFHLAQRNGWANPRTKTDDYTKLEDRTDTGNANLLVRLTGGNLRFVPERRLWILWDGSKWTGDEFGSVAWAAAQKVAQHYHARAQELKKQADGDALSKDERKRLDAAVESVEKWAGHCRNKRTIDAMLALASKNPQVVVPVSSLDTDPWLFGVANGVVDMRTGQLRPEAREEFVTKRSPIAFDPAAQAPRWVRFIEEIMGTPLPAEFDPTTGLVAPGSVGRYRPRPALASYLQRALGYGLTGAVVEHKMFFAIGPGSNGKNILLDTVLEVSGGYGKTIPPEALMATRHDADAERPSPTAATLAGARLAVSSESRDGQKLDVALVKRHTGGGFMTARMMRENTFTFPISHKLWLMTNHRPGLDHMDDALRGRLHLIPFDRQWNRPGHPARNEELPDGDKDLMATLRAEACGILVWLIQGAVRYAKEGLEPPEEVARMTRTYFAEQDPIGRWVETQERCEPQRGTQASALYAQFTKDLGTESAGVTEKAFCQALGNRHGINKCKKKAGMHYGLALNGMNEPGKVQGAG